MNPRSIPCRMCQAGPGEFCKYKNNEIPLGSVLGGHRVRTPKSYRCYHYKRVEDFRLVEDAITPPTKSARRRRSLGAVPVASARCRWQ